MTSVESVEDLWAAPETLLRTWLAAAQDARNGHRLTGKRRRDRHTKNAMCLLIISGLTTTSSLVALVQDFPFGKWLLAVSAVVTTVLGAIQAFAKYDEQAKHHEGGRSGYACVCRLIEEALALPRSERGEIKAVLDDIRTRLDDLSKMTVPIPEDLWQLGVTERKALSAVPSNAAQPIIPPDAAR
jgi:hypothetical protein